MKICFVCTGNIVRSPLAENLFLHQAEQAGVDGRYQVDSAAIGPWHVGEPPDRRMVQVAAGHGLHYSGRARQIRKSDLQEFDLLIVMDRDHLDELLALAGSADVRDKLHLLREFDPLAVEAGQLEVPDPYYGGTGGFEDVLDMVERACDGLLDEIRTELDRPG
jgi:protein-tyrosine phosphatase